MNEFPKPSQPKPLPALAVVLGVAALVLCEVFIAGQANASSITYINPLQSPPAKPLVVAVNCGTEWNPSCAPTASSSLGIRVTSSFYIDGRRRGAANVTYTNVCSVFRLRDGRHTALVYARDAYGNVARASARIVCDRTKPYATPGIRGVAAYPRASDATSGIASRQFFVDLYERPWQSYRNLCTTFSLRAGVHVARVRAVDRAGNVRDAVQNFRCR